MIIISGIFIADSYLESKEHLRSTLKLCLKNCLIENLPKIVVFYLTFRLNIFKFPKCTLIEEKNYNYNK